MPEPRLRWAVARDAWHRARERWWLRWSVDLGVATLLFLAITSWQTRHLPSGTLAPDFQLRTLSGEQVRLSELRGKPVVLEFWAPWCGVCKAESSTLSAVKSLVGERAHVLTIAVAYDNEADVRRFVQEQGVDYPVLLGEASLPRELHVDSFPTTFILSPEGRIENATVGYTTRLGLLWRLWHAS